MNYSMISYILGWIFNFEAAFMILPGITAIIYREKNGLAFLITMLICLTIGIPLTRRKRKSKVFHAKEGAVTVALSWLVLSIAGALPFIISGSIPHPIDAIFETVSGFTTTGASILSDVEALSHCMLIWRSFTHWIGGMGVLVFILCLLPLTGGYHMNLMKAESPGPSVSKLVPKVQSTAKILYTIYIILTVVEIIFLLIGKMPLFDTLCLSFGTAGTGGFGIKNDSIASYSTYNQVVITVFMILFGINFNAYYLLLTKKVMQAAKNEEVRYYLGIIGLAIVAIAINTREMFTSFGRAFQQAAFQVGSIITTTGYATTDFNVWPVFSKTILVILMFVGACAGSTGGGIKVTTFAILLLVTAAIVRGRPEAVVGKRSIGRDLVRSAAAIAVLAMVLVLTATFIICIIEEGNPAATMETILYECVSAFGTVGLSCGITPQLAPMSKLLLMFLMFCGRVGPLTFSIALANRKKKDTIHYPEGRIMVG